MILSKRVLVLNANYEPLGVCTVRRAIVMVIGGRAEMIEPYPDQYIHTVKVKYPAPSILRLYYFINLHKKDITLTKGNILRRDGHRCQYCGKKGKKMTIDHVIPKKRGGKDKWENLVCACPSCNAKKGDKIPEEAGMRLLRKPKKPYYVYFAIRNLDNIPKNWQPYVYYMTR